MNLITAIVLVTLFTDYVVHVLADILNLNMLRDELPEAFQEYYDPESYQKSQEYLFIFQTLLDQSKFTLHDS